MPGFKTTRSYFIEKSYEICAFKIEEPRMPSRSFERDMFFITKFRQVSPFQKFQFTGLSEPQCFDV